MCTTLAPKTNSPYSMSDRTLLVRVLLVAGSPNSSLIGYTFRSATLTVESEFFRCLERFTAVIYDRTSSLECLNEAQRELFCQKNRTMENIPPMQDALQHAALETVTCILSGWNLDYQQQEAPSPEEYGRTLNKEN